MSKLSKFARKVADKGNRAIERAVNKAPGLSDNAKQLLISSNPAHSYGQMLQETGGGKSTSEKRESLRAHHFRTIHPAHPTTQKLRQADEDMASTDPDIQERGRQKRAEANQETKTISSIGAMFGLSSLLSGDGGGSDSGASDFASTVAGSGGRRNGPPGGEASNFPQNDTYLPDGDRETVLRLRQRDRALNQPKSFTASLVNLLWSFLAPKRS